MGYASDYPLIKIASWETINGVEVPLDQYGHYLDWTEINSDRTEARMLTSPYGWLHFAVGFGERDEDDGDITVCYDFAELPDGRIVLHAVVDSDSGGFIDNMEYSVVDREHAYHEACGIADQGMDIVAFNGGEHDREGWNQDDYYFPRSVAQHLGMEPYKSMTEEQLRFGDGEE